MRILLRKSRSRKDFTSRLAHGRRGWKKWSTGIKLVLRVLNLCRHSNISGNCYFLGWKRNGKGKDGFMSLPVDSILSTFCTFMFPILNTIRLNILVHDVINLLYYEHWTDKYKYFYVFPILLQNHHHSDSTFEIFLGLLHRFWTLSLFYAFNLSSLLFDSVVTYVVVVPRALRIW